VAEEDDGMYDDDPNDDAERELQEALALSMVPNSAPEARGEPDSTRAANAPKKDAQPVAEEPQVDIDENFMKDVIGDLGIDINES
jgi:hypothetical protein